MVTVKIENYYTDGHESTREVLIPPPTGYTEDEIEEWFTDVVFDYTGDGHGIGNKLGSCYTATVLACEDPRLLGQTSEWVD